jgi:hypothetical protein
MTSAIDSMFSELMGMADSVQEEVDGAGEDFDVMSLLHRRSYNNVQRPAFRRNPNVPVITQPWTILRHHDYYYYSQNRDLGLFFVANNNGEIYVI